VGLFPDFFRSDLVELGRDSGVGLSRLSRASWGLGLSIRLIDGSIGSVEGLVEIWLLGWFDRWNGGRGGVVEGVVEQWHVHPNHQTRSVTCLDREVVTVIQCGETNYLRPRSYIDC
jgi:hypothetical protein